MTALKSPLYEAVNTLVAHIGQAGSIDSKHPAVDAVMTALGDVDAAASDFPTVAQARRMGEVGAPHDEQERLLYEAYCEGHCWKVGPWHKGAYYEMSDRIRFAMWRDRAALAKGLVP